MRYMQIRACVVKRVDGLNRNLAQFNERAIHQSSGTGLDEAISTAHRSILYVLHQTRVFKGR